MPAINYKKQFASLVETGQKMTTIRAGNRIKVGDTLYHYTGMRTKNCRKLGESVASEVHKIDITQTPKMGMYRVVLDGKGLITTDLYPIVAADGFNSIKQFLDFFAENHGLIFIGQLIKWKTIKTADTLIFPPLFAPTQKELDIIMDEHDKTMPSPYMI